MSNYRMKTVRSVILIHTELVLFTLNKCWVVLTQIWVQYGQTHLLG